jgi:hypothetical protein
MQNEEKMRLASKLYILVLRGVNVVFDKVMRQIRDFYLVFSTV